MEEDTTGEIVNALEVDLDLDLLTGHQKALEIRLGLKRISTEQPPEIPAKIFLKNSAYNIVASIYMNESGVGTVVME